MHLGCAAKIDPRVGSRRDLPIDVHLKVTIVLCRAQTLAFAVIRQHAVGNTPMLAHDFVSSRLSFLERVALEGSSRDRVLMCEPLPPGEIFVAFADAVVVE